MPKTPPNHGKQWTKDDKKTLRDLVKQNTPTGLIAKEVQRTEAAVRSKASELGISLKPTNQSPYNRRPR